MERAGKVTRNRYLKSKKISIITETMLTFFLRILRMLSSLIILNKFLNFTKNRKPKSGSGVVFNNIEDQPSDVLSGASITYNI